MRGAEDQQRQSGMACLAFAAAGPEEMNKLETVNVWNRLQTKNCMLFELENHEDIDKQQLEY